MRKLLAVALLAGGLLAAAASPIPFEVRWEEREMAYYKGLVAAEVFDPASALFRHLYYRERNATFVHLCGEINPKNRMGSHTGYMLFSAKFYGTFPTHHVELLFGTDENNARVEAACKMPPR